MIHFQEKNWQRWIIVCIVGNLGRQLARYRSWNFWKVWKVAGHTLGLMAKTKKSFRECWQVRKTSVVWLLTSTGTLGRNWCFNELYVPALTLGLRRLVELLLIILGLKIVFKFTSWLLWVVDLEEIRRIMVNIETNLWLFLENQFRERRMRGKLQVLLAC